MLELDRESTITTTWRQREAGGPPSSCFEEETLEIPTEMAKKRSGIGLPFQPIASSEDKRVRGTPPICKCAIS